MGFPKARRGYDPATLGSCRSNESLNGLKAAEIRSLFAVSSRVRSISIMKISAVLMALRRRGSSDATNAAARWPNDSLAAADGGAGGLANGYSALIRGINGIRNPSSGYDAARDCQIILVSPVYVPSAPGFGPPGQCAGTMAQYCDGNCRLASNVDVCFREVWPLSSGGERWTERFRVRCGPPGESQHMAFFCRRCRPICNGLSSQRRPCNERAI